MKAFTGTAVATLIPVIACGMGRSKPISVQTNSVDLHNEDDQINQARTLIFQSGVNLTSHDPCLGGFPGLQFQRMDATSVPSPLSVTADKGVEAPAWLRDGRLNAIEKNFPKNAPLTLDWIFDKI